MPLKKNIISSESVEGDHKDNSYLASAHKNSATDIARLERLLLQAELTGRTGAWEWDTSSDELYVSAGFLNIIQYDKNSLEFTGNYILHNILYPHDLHLFMQVHNQLLQTGQSYETTARLISKSGEIINVSITGQLEKPGTVAGTIRDITAYTATAGKLTLNEKRYHAVMEYGTGAFCILNIEGKPLYLSPSVKNVLGYTVEEAMKLDLFSLTHPDDQEQVAKKWQESIERPGVLVHGYTSRILHKDGSWRWMEDTIVNMLHDPDIQGIVDNFHDVTERIEAINEAVLKQQLAEEAQTSYRQIFERATDGILVLDMQTARAIDVNQQACEILGCNREELMQSTADQFLTGLPEFSGELLYSYFEKAIKEGPQSFDWISRKKTGEFTWLGVSLSKADIAGEEQVLTFIKDINKRKTAELRLLKSEAELAEAQHLAKVGSWNFDVATGELVWSDELYRIFGVDKQNFILNDVAYMSMINAADKEKVKQKKQQVLKDGKPFKVEYTIQVANDKKKVIFELGKGQYDTHGTLIRVIGTAQDITEQKLVEASEKALEKRFEAIFNQANDAIMLADDNGHYVQVNPAAAMMLGYTQAELLQISAYHITRATHPKNTIAEQWDAFRKNTRQTGIIELERKNGSVIICQYNAVADILPGLHLSIITDITDREGSRRQIERQRKYIDTVLNSITDGFYSVDKNWNITYWNREAEKLILRKKEDLLGKNLWEEFKDAIPLKFYTEYHKAVEQNISVRFEEYFPPLDLWVGVSAYPSAEGLAVYFQDITERKHIEQELRASMERYYIAAKVTTDSIWDWNLLTNEVTRPGNLLEVNFGYPPQESGNVINHWSQYAHPDDWKVLNEKRNAVFADPDIRYWEDEYRFLKANGQYAYIYARGYIFRDENGIAIRMIGATKDISRHKEQINEILRIQQNFDSLINTTTDLIWSVDTGLKIIAANKAYDDLVFALTGKHVAEGDPAKFDIAGITQFENWQTHIQKALGGETVNIEKSFFNPLAKEDWHTIATFSPIYDQQGHITGVACYEKNITELKNAGKKLEELNEALEIRAAELAASNAELERFAYVASHDLQEPLRMVTSFLQLLQKKYKGLIDETAAKYIGFSIDGADRMKQLISDLLQYSRAGTAQLELSTVNMNEVTQAVVILYRNELPVINAEIIVQPLPTIYAGKSAMIQLMQNLVSNALKYRDKEKTIVEISCKEEMHEWIFSVADNGIGIDAKFSDKIFVIFQRLHNKDEYTGTGIGLAICKKIVERYQGKIWVESEPHIGSKFIFTIPKAFN